MTSITKQRGPWQVNAVVRYKSSARPLVVTIGPEVVTTRAKGTRTKYSLTWSAIHLLAARAMADAARREKAEARTTKKKRRTARGLLR